MKICFLIPHLLAFGGIRRIIELTNSLVDLGHVVYLFPESKEKYEWPLIKAKVLTWDDRLKQAFDVCCFSLESQHKEPEALTKRGTVYYILHYGAMYKMPEVCKASYRQPYYKVTNSKWTALKILDDCGDTPLVVSSAINRQYFYPVKCEKEYDLLCYGSKRLWKGTAKLEEIAQKCNLELERYDGKNLPQTKMGEEYSKAKIFLSGSQFEGWNWPCLEAMACGVPVIKTVDGGSAEYTENGVNCIECNYDEMPSAVTKVTEDKKLCNKLISGGFNTAAKYSNLIKPAREFEFHCKKAAGLL